MVKTYALELQGNKDKFVMYYVSEIIKKAVAHKFIFLEDLYSKKETELISIFEKNFASWKIFHNAKEIISTNKKPKQFYMNNKSKKRNTIPLLKTIAVNKRINEISEIAKKNYLEIEKFKDLEYAYIEKIEEL